MIHTDEKISLLSRTPEEDSILDYDERTKADIWDDILYRVCHERPNEENLDLIKEIVWEEYIEKICDMGLN